MSASSVNENVLMQADQVPAVEAVSYVAAAMPKEIGPPILLNEAATWQVAGMGFCVYCLVNLLRSIAR